MLEGYLESTFSKMKKESFNCSSFLKCYLDNSAFLPEILHLWIQDHFDFQNLHAQ